MCVVPNPLMIKVFFFGSCIPLGYHRHDDDGPAWKEYRYKNTCVLDINTWSLVTTQPLGLMQGAGDGILTWKFPFDLGPPATAACNSLERERERNAIGKVTH